MGKKGGKVTAEKYGSEFYREIGKKGRKRLTEIIAAGKAAEASH